MDDSSRAPIDGGEDDAPATDPHETLPAQSVSGLRGKATLSIDDRDTLKMGPSPVADVDVELVAVAPEIRYETRTLLGEGGMGEVRLCADAHIGRDVAMKIARSSGKAKGSAGPRFLREARIQGQLEHPAIVPVYDLGRQQDGTPFFTMRRVRGETLESILEELAKGDRATHAKYSRHKLLGAFSRVCLAIDFSHKKSVIHRDLKPANIMFGDFGEVYVLDWGLAKVIAPVGEIDATGTSTRAPVDITAAETTDAGEILGTPGYMAPEQVLGRANEIDARTDVFALGVILFELLTYSPLFGEGAATELFARTLRKNDARPSIRAPEAGIGPELDAICVKAVAPDPNARYTSARELHLALDAFLSGDRDVARRKELAHSFAESARTAAEHAFATHGTDAERSAALRDVGRALALDPNDSAALALLIRLVTQPPRELPPEVARTIARAMRSSRRGSQRVGVAVVFAAALFVYAPMMVFMGVRNWPLAAMCLFSWVVFGAAIALSYKNTGETRIPYVVLAGFFCVTASSVAFGPLLLAPALALSNTIAFVLTGRKAHRVFAVFAGCLAVCAPLGLEWVGVLPRSFAFEDGTLRLYPQALNFSPAPTAIFLLVTTTLLIVIAAYFVTRYRDLLSLAERRSELHAWQLRQLVPDEAKGALATLTSESLREIQSSTVIDDPDAPPPPVRSE